MKTATGPYRRLVVVASVWGCMTISGWPVSDVGAQVADGGGRGRYRPHEIQAAFIYNFIDYVKWPDRSGISTREFIIGILGEDHFGSAFAPVVGKPVMDKTLVVKKSERLTDLLNCSILFIASSEAGHMEEIMATLGSRPILTVSDMEGFTRMGGMIQFYSAEVDGETKVRFDINKGRVESTEIKIGFQLLSLSKPKK